MDEKEIKQINEKIKKKGARWIATETPFSIDMGEHIWLSLSQILFHAGI